MGLEKRVAATSDRDFAVSVIIPTLDRCRSLISLLEALRWQTMTSFEVVVVVGPCSDETERLLQSYAETIRVVHNLERNVSMSRNIGITASMGDILAFIDDDEIPEPTWLEELVAGFTDDSVGAVGGAVLGINGRDLDWLWCSADMYGAAYLSVDEPTHLQQGDGADPARQRVQYFPGGNCAIRRVALNAIEGFDEAIVYYLDETEMFLRLQRAGWMMRQLQGARIHHLQLAGIVRAADDQRVTNWITILQSRVTFAGKHAVALVGSERVIDELIEWASHVRSTLSENDAIEGFDRELEIGKVRLRNLAGGKHAGLDSPTHFGIHDADPSRVVPFPTVHRGAQAHLVLVCGQPAPHIEATNSLQLARSFALRGHIVRLIVAGDRAATRWAEGVWVHEIETGVADSDWDLAVGNELDRIDAQMQIDFVNADCPAAGRRGWTPIRLPKPHAGVERDPAWSSAAVSTGLSFFGRVSRSVKNFARRGRTFIGPPVFVRFIGGAGNQLFQYATALTIGGEKWARAIASSEGKQLEAEALVPGFFRYTHGRHLRTLDPMTESVEGRSAWRQRVAAPLRRLVAGRTVDQHGELRLAFQPRFAGTRRPVLLDGYFQHPTWYSPGDAVIIRTLRTRSPQRCAGVSTASYAVVNFRRRDFETLGWAIADAYYDAALHLLGSGLPLVVTGDDQEVVERMRSDYRDRGFDILEPEPMASNEAVSDFWTMVGAQSVIMSNSTFCWWATRVGDSVGSSLGGDRLVICPRNWIPGLDSELPQPNWTVLDNRFLDADEVVGMTT